MKVYRIEREKYLDGVLSGGGASKMEVYRWNSINTSVVYTSASRALATLEVSVHIDLSEDLPTDRFYVEIDIPEDVKILELNMDDLPPNWDSKPPILETQFIGDDFVALRSAAVLKVPSSIVPPEFNFLINSAHPDSVKIKVISVEALVFDGRMVKK